MLERPREGKTGTRSTSANVVLDGTETLRERVQGVQLLNLEAGRIAVEILLIFLLS
jgi:hypothetical protein